MFVTSILLAIFGLSQAQSSCPELSCSVDCLIPVKDQWGCPTCACDWCDSVTSNYCKIDCDNGYELFELTMNDEAAGVWCPMCKCAESSSNSTEYEASSQAYEKQETLADVSLNLKKAWRVQNIAKRHGEEGEGFEDLKRGVLDLLGIDEKDLEEWQEHRPSLVNKFDIDEKQVEEFQEGRAERPPMVPLALKRHQTAEMVNRTRQDVAPTRDWSQLNQTDAWKKIAVYLSQAEETPRYDELFGPEGFKGRDGEDNWEFNRISDRVDDDVAKAAKEARENFQEADHYGLFVYRMFIKTKLENEASELNDVLTDAQRAQAKKMVATLSKKAQANDGDFDLDKALEEFSKSLEERTGNFAENKQNTKENFYRNLKDHLDLDKEVEEALDERVENINHHPARLAVLKHKNEQANADWSINWGGSFNFGPN